MIEQSLLVQLPEDGHCLIGYDSLEVCVHGPMNWLIPILGDEDSAAASAQAYRRSMCGCQAGTLPEDGHCGHRLRFFGGN